MDFYSVDDMLLIRKHSCETNNIEGKAIPLQAETGPKGSRRLRFPDFKTVGT